jgi:hypothetical protein
VTIAPARELGKVGIVEMVPQRQGRGCVPWVLEGTLPPAFEALTDCARHHARAMRQSG